MRTYDNPTICSTETTGLRKQALIKADPKTRADYVIYDWECWIGIAEVCICLLLIMRTVVRMNTNSYGLSGIGAPGRSPWAFSRTLVTWALKFSLLPAATRPNTSPTWSRSSRDLACIIRAIFLHTSIKYSWIIYFMFKKLKQVFVEGQRYGAEHRNWEVGAIPETWRGSGKKMLSCVWEGGGIEYTVSHFARLICVGSRPVKRKI